MGNDGCHLILLVLLLIFMVAPTAQATGDDPWLFMQDFFPTEKEDVSVKPVATKLQVDPWAELQEYFIPFTEQQEVEALSNYKRAVAIAGKLHNRLYPFRAYIARAAAKFRVPPEIIGAVIMVESSGNPRAKAKTSSAKGLMQTIDSTFEMARKALHKEGVVVAQTPYNVQASIMTGTWYLAQMYDQASRDGRVESQGRNVLRNWKIPAEYYYAGPGHGRKKRDVVITYAGGKKIVIDKPVYSQKVLRWATIMATAASLQ